MQRERVSAVSKVCEGVGTVSQCARTHLKWSDAAAKPAAPELVGCELLTGWDCRHRQCVVVVVVVVIDDCRGSVVRHCDHLALHLELSLLQLKLVLQFHLLFHSRQLLLSLHLFLKRLNLCV